MPPRAISLLICLLLGSLPAAYGEEFVLAENGKARAPIVLSQGATERQHELAAELADYLERISGAEFEVVTGDDTEGIVLGTLD